jgi:hypothetical protein
MEVIPMKWDDLNIAQKTFAAMINGMLIDELHEGLITQPDSSGRSLLDPYDIDMGVCESEYHHKGRITTPAVFNVIVDASINYSDDGKTRYYACVDVETEGDGDNMIITPDILMDLDDSFFTHVPGRKVLEFMYDKLRTMLTEAVAVISIDNMEIMKHEE